MLICNALTVLAAILLIFYLSERLKKSSVKATFIKSVVSVFFIAVALCAWQLSGLTGVSRPIGYLVLLGLVLGLLGDVWLDLKFVFPTEDDPLTYSGFIVFGVGHLFYIAGLISYFYPKGKIAYLLVPILIAVLLGIGNLLLEKPMKLRFGKMKPVVFAYSLCLFSTVMISGSFALYHAFQLSTLNLIFLGSVLFAISDLILSGTYFGTGKDRPVDIICNYLFYYSGQFLIAYSLMFL